MVNHCKRLKELCYCLCFCINTIYNICLTSTATEVPISIAFVHNFSDFVQNLPLAGWLAVSSIVLDNKKA